MATKLAVLQDAAKQKGCLGRAHPEEPVFVLRAQDRLAPIVVKFWAMLAEEYGCGDEKTHGALVIAEEMRRWQKEHGTKYPD